MAKVLSSGPGVFVISLSPTEQWRLKRNVRSSQEPVTETMLLARLIQGWLK